MERLTLCVNPHCWYIGFYVAKHEVGTLLSFSILPLTIIVRLGGAK